MIRQRLVRLAERGLRTVRRWSTPRGEVTTEIAGVHFALDLNEYTHRKIWTHGAFEPDLTSVLGGAARDGDVFVDVGANFGWHTLMLCAPGAPVVAVHAFEPGTHARTLLERAVRENSLHNRVTIHPLAVGAEEGETTLRHFPNLGSVHSSRFPLGTEESRTETVRTTTLDALCQTLGQAPAVIKCDVEGGELDVLRGATDLLRGVFGSPPIWFLEANYETAGMAGYHPLDLLEFASECSSYQGYSLRGRTAVPIRARTNLRHGDDLVLAIPGVHDARLQFESS